MQLSEKFIKEIKNWEVISLPKIVFHGCCHGDRGLDLIKKEIAGNKWFSQDAFFAGEYCWHHTREHKFPKFRIELETNDIYAINCPDNLQGESWVPFLSECFPNVIGYELSYNFQDSLKFHLEKLGKTNLLAFLSGKEICIPEAEKHTKFREIIKLPNEKFQYVSIYNQKNNKI
ncbi:hypothetical protein ALP73_200124 [Pseudomonas coronafaciens pv. garcae]|uniref:hypothetical protein n=1 Tax=Pseudomonas syringae group TaxID=136849 RepID=UPI000F3EF02D|nr:hypothetical protein [Pseudomonas coronafaciens]RMS04939.1 hypothetical protein ALP73_200124 [Pseudomonas coronafaciens pv. garcae]